MNSSVLILLVEDDPDIQDLPLDTLEEAGFEVAQASNAEDAIKILEERQADRRALVTDIDFGGRPDGTWCGDHVNF